MTAVSRSTSSRRAAHVLLDRYPRRWRTRYGVEMHAMLDAMPVTWRQVADLALGAVREWLSPRALGWPARSAAGRVLTVRGLLFMSAVILFDAGLHVVVEPGSPLIDLSVLEPTVVVLTMAALMRGVVGYWQVTTAHFAWLARQRWLGSVKPAETSVWIGVLGLWMLYGHARPESSYARDPTLRVIVWHLQSYYFANCLSRASERSQRLRRVEFAHLRRLSTAADQELFKLPSRLGRP